MKCEQYKTEKPEDMKGKFFMSSGFCYLIMSRWY